MKTKLGANTPTITLSEAVTWVAYGKKFYSREDVNNTTLRGLRLTWGIPKGVKL